MQKTSEKYQRLRESGAGYEVMVNIAGKDYDAGAFKSIKTASNVFDSSMPTVGSCVSAEIDIEMFLPSAEIPRMAAIKPYVRLTDGTEHSEWLQKGVYYIDTRSIDSTAHTLTIHGYDAMLKADADFDTSVITGWPKTDIDVVRLIASCMGVGLDARTVEKMTAGYEIQLPTGYSYREALGYIAAMYAGCFVMSDTGELRLVSMLDIGTDSDSYLITEWGNGITFGGDLIAV